MVIRFFMPLASRVSCRARLIMPRLIIASVAVALGCDSPDPQQQLLGVVDAERPVLARAAQYSQWSPAVRLEAAGAPADPAFNTSSLDGCPLMSRDGKSFYMASTRPGGLGGIDIWVSTRSSEDEPWGAPVNVGAPINSANNDFCPTIDRDGRRFFFVSERATWAGGAACGGADIYATRFRSDGTAEEPQNLGCNWNGGPNSAANEASPSPLPESGSGPVLYFSSARAGGLTQEAVGAVAGDQDIYMSRSHGGVYGPAELVEGVNSASEDAQPNVRRDALEIFFFSTRPGTLGGPDIYAATRARTSDSWSAPVNLGANVNSTAADSRPSISWDGTVLHFGSTRSGGEGLSDIYMTTRQKLNGSD